jgi:hypothetical protein
MKWDKVTRAINISSYELAVRREISADAWMFEERDGQRN